MTKDQNIPTTAFYTDLDTLFDTRFATLMRYWSDDDVQRILDAGYHTRDSDFFKFINVTKFQKLYEERDIHTFKLAVITPVLQMIKNFVAGTMVNIATSPFHMQPKIILNVHPYILSEKDSKTLTRILDFETDRFAEIELVNFPLTELDPAYVNHHLAGIAIYDSKTWLDHFSINQRFAKVRCPAVAMFSPQINRKNRTKLAPEIFQAYEEQAREFIDLHLLGIHEFSLVLKRSAT